MRRLGLAVVLLVLWGGAAAAEETAAEHLSAFIARDLSGDGFDRLGPFLEAPAGAKNGCGCSSSGNHFDIAGDPVLVADGWKLTRIVQASPERAVGVVRFHLLGDSRMKPEAFGQGRFRSLKPFARPRWLTRRYRLERQFDGGWALLADQRPVVAAKPLAQALDDAKDAAFRTAPARFDYYRREADKAHKLESQSTHKVLAD
ncbi:MAG TPA: hypothetical protein VM661_11590 [Candidatus Sulfotelmatobacter sp.]|jgi:hypothetical protein|nr:hypothetical protein [Candidatus Sulfotelmatobacter sp.]